MRRPTIVGAAVSTLRLTSAVPAFGSASPDACKPAPVPTAAARTDGRPSGNRVVDACGPLRADRTVVELPALAAWVLPDPAERGRSWIAALQDGRVVRVRDGVVSDMPLVDLAPGEPPIATARHGGTIVRSANVAESVFETALPDARLVEAPGGALVALTEPTRRYPHAVLGDESKPAPSASATRTAPCIASTPPGPTSSRAWRHHRRPRRRRAPRDRGHAQRCG